MAKPRREQMLPIYVLNGPNLNLLGRREPEIYGTQTLADIGKSVAEHAASFDWAVDFRQSNHEGELVDWLHDARDKALGVVINAGAYSHTSIALLDACRALGKPLVEVHLSNPYGREPFRRHSYISEVANGVICGFGGAGYRLAIDALSELLKAQAR